MSSPPNPRRQPAELALCLALALAAFAITIYFFCPRFALWQGLNVPEASFTSEVNRAAFVLKQVDDPWLKIEDRTNRIQQWRLLFPLIGHYAHLPRWAFLALPHVGCVALLAYVAHLVLGARGSRLTALLAATLVAAAPWFFVSTGWLTYSDSWYLLGLTIVTFGRSRVAVVLACALAPFVDERFVLNLPLACVLRVVWLDLFARENRRALWADVLAVALPTLAFVAFRIVLLSKLDRTTGEYVNEHWGYFLSAKWYRYAEGLWMGMRAGWVLVVALLWLLQRAGRDWEIRLLLVALAATIFLSLFMAADIARSSSSMVPAALLGLLLMMRDRPNWVRRWLPWLVALNLLLPASHIILHQRRGILNLYAEIDRFHNPPTYLDPGVYTPLAIELRREGRLEESRRALDAALKLAPHRIDALAQRALVNLELNDPTAAAADAERALAVDSTAPDALYARGAVDLHAGDLSGAVSRLQQALFRAPIDWSLRLECTQLLARASGDSPAATTRPTTTTATGPTTRT